MNKQCSAQPTVELASHDNNMEAFMDDYIFHNTLAKTPSLLTYELECNMQKEMWEKQLIYTPKEHFP